MLPNVIVGLEREVVKQGEFITLSLVTMTKSYNFVATLYLFSNILPHNYRLSRILQDKQVDLTMIKPNYRHWPSVNNTHNSPSHSLRHTDNDFKTTMKDCNI